MGNVIAIIPSELAKQPKSTTVHDDENEAMTPPTPIHQDNTHETSRTGPRRDDTSTNSLYCKRRPLSI